MARVRVELDAPAGLLPLSPGAYVIGRAETCDVVVESGRASREHARLVVTEAGATLEDLSSANGTFVNGDRLESPRELANKDFIVIGDVAIDVMMTPSEETVPDPERPSVVMRTGKGVPQHISTSNVLVHDVLEGLANTQLAAGDVSQAERTLEGWLTRLRSNVDANQRRDLAGEDAAVRCSIKLAAATSSARWVDYAVGLCAAIGRPFNGDEAAILGPAIERAGVADTALEAYAQMLTEATADAVARALVQRWAGRAVRR